VIHLERNEIIFINKTQLSFGGFDSGQNENLENSNSFEYLLNIVSESYFGQKRYKDVYEVASAYVYFIIKDHIFFDGCKRTGVHSSLLFLKKNGLELKQEASKLITKFTIRIEKKELSFDQIVEWFKKNTIKG
jgi:death-on-curing protein